MREYRLVTVTGAAGIGKTQTALRVATAPGADPPICFVDLASIDKSSLVVPAVVTALAVQAIPHHPLLETLAAYLKCKNQLLILDNCEHVVAEVAPLSETLLLNCPGVQILATSREPVKCAGERTYRLPSLAPAHAIALFVDRACDGSDIEITCIGVWPYYRGGSPLRSIESVLGTSVSGVVISI
jgi:predicted ATPase